MSEHRFVWDKSIKSWPAGENLVPLGARPRPRSVDELAPWLVRALAEATPNERALLERETFGRAGAARVN